MSKAKRLLHKIRKTQDKKRKYDAKMDLKISNLYCEYKFFKRLEK